MALDPRKVTEIMRQRLGLPDASKAAAITLQIPQALKETGRRMAADPTTRALLQTDRTVATIPLSVGGKVPLATAYTTHKIIKEFIEYGQMYFCPSLPFGTSDVDVSNNTITVRGERFKVGDKVRFTTTTTLPAGLTLATDYWIASYNAATNLITVATSLANALNNVVVDITNQGSGTHTIAVQETVDYPMSKIAGPQAAPFDRYLATSPLVPPLRRSRRLGRLAARPAAASTRPRSVNGARRSRPSRRAPPTSPERTRRRRLGPLPARSPRRRRRPRCRRSRTPRARCAAWPPRNCRPWPPPASPSRSTRKRSSTAARRKASPPPRRPPPRRPPAPRRPCAIPPSVALSKRTWPVPIRKSCPRTSTRCSSSTPTSRRTSWSA